MYDSPKAKTMTEKAFDPRDFISPPFKTCPECGHETFGVLTISKAATPPMPDCWHMVKRILCLQCGRNHLPRPVRCQQPNEAGQSYPTAYDKLAPTVLAELRDLLTELRDLQLIVCPDSTSHVSESRISPFNAELKKTYEHLSGGITFNSFSDISNSQIGELARACLSNVSQSSIRSMRILSDDPNKWNDRFYITFHDIPS